MSHKIQITVDDRFDKIIKAGAKKKGLSVSSYTRLVLTTVLQRKNNKLIDQALNDIKTHNTEHLSFSEFSRQLDEL